MTKEEIVKKRIKKHINTLIILLSISIFIYFILISDILLLFEFFLFFIMIFTIFFSIVVFTVTVAEIAENRYKVNLFSSITISVILILFLIFFSIRNGLFEGQAFFSGAFIDDRSRIDLTLYKNRKFIAFASCMVCEERFDGFYNQKADSIIFEDCPFINKYFDTKVFIIDKDKQKIYFEIDQNGVYDSSFYYFQVDK